MFVTISANDHLQNNDHEKRWFKNSVKIISVVFWNFFFVVSH